MSAEWQHGLCGCFDNFTVCIITYVFPCYTAGKTGEAVGDSCLVCGLLACVPFVDFVAAAMIRGKVREQKQIEGGFLGDLVLSFCCYCCVLAQSAQEVNAMGNQAQSISRS
eukprot:GHVU01107907.1.p1 GENE.GHVU01107907.1~~GHVU01107907.1.p1  ORF type:complete len:111 (+),score=14.34 GHVU01107907.1:99-431(+)